MIRVLQCVNNMHRAGLETVLMNYYRNIDREKIQFDFLTHRPEKSDYDDEIESLGGRIYHAPRLFPQNFPAYFTYMKQFFREHQEYKIVHSHIDAMSYLPLLAAKKAGVPIRIAHSHSISIDLDFKYPLKQYYRYQLKKVASHYFACGQMAGEFLFRCKEFQVIPNAIDSSQFLYDETVRKKKRRELGVGDAFVMGHVGRFTYAKNHAFLLEIFSRLLYRVPNAVLLLVGTGEKESEIRKQADNLKISNSIIFLGSRTDVSGLYQAMDVFVMPSRFEGVPVVGIEAQFSGLPCFFSNQVPQEVMFTDQCHFIDVQQNADQWASAILRDGKVCRDSKNITYPIYDVKYASHILEDNYMELQAKPKKLGGNLYK